MDNLHSVWSLGMSPSGAQQLLRRVSRRQAIVQLARRGRLFLLIAIALYALALLLSRLFAVIPPWFTPVTLTIVSAVSLILALLLRHRSDQVEAARLVDTQMRTRDLFLTASLIDHSLGAYQALVLRQAEQRAAEILPQRVVRYDWHRDAATVCAALAAVGLGVYSLPQLDPFGLHRQQRQLTEQRQRLRATQKATEVRAALLEQKRAGEQTDLIKQALTDLEKTFKEAKPNDKAGTLARLNEQQKQLGQLWKQTSEEKLKNALNLPPPGQSFGLNDPAKADRLKNDLQKGDVSSANKELDELKKKVRELAATTDPVSKEKLRQELMDRLQSLKDTLDQQLNAQPVDTALQRALEQLALSNVPGLSGESLKGLSDSLSLTQEELGQLARAMADMKNLEEALKALQLAKTLHNLQPLDGHDFIGFGDLAMYEAFCAGKCKSLCAGMGLGPGYGYGPRPYGDERVDSVFHSEKSPSLLQPGRMLMEWKTREVTEAGSAREEYLRAVQDVRQQASEAIVQEQIPPGYQSAIKRYFDTFRNDATPTSQP
jgi:tetratricopeptide (TPR) repeat protein